MLALYTGKERPERDRIARYNDIACVRASHNLCVYPTTTIDIQRAHCAQQQKRTKRSVRSTNI